jgi:hypothetical protein
MLIKTAKFSPAYYNMRYLPLLRVQENINMARLQSCIRPSINTHPGFSGRNANQNIHGTAPSTKMIKLRAIKGNEKSPWRGSH